MLAYNGRGGSSVTKPLDIAVIGAGVSGLASAMHAVAAHRAARALHARLRDLTFDRRAIVPCLRREMIRTLAGLKTGLFASRDPAAIVNCVPGADARARAAE